MPNNETFTAELIGGRLVVKAKVVKTPNASGGTDVIVKVPSFRKIEEAKRKYLKEMLTDGERNIQQV